MSKPNDASANSAPRILNAALELFSEKGYEATSIREICDRAAITRPTLYYFYKSKEGVYRALVREAIEESETKLTQGLEAPGDLRLKYKRVARVLFADAKSRPKLWRFIFNVVWSTTSPFAADLHESYAGFVRCMANAARQAIKEGQVDGSALEHRMLVVMGSLGESLAGYLILGRPNLTPKLADGIIDAVFDGWRKGHK